MLCPMRYSPIIYTFELKVMPHVICGFSCLKEGAVDFLIAQQPTAQGYSGVESLCNHLIFKKEVKQCNYMPITLLAVENVDFYLDAHKK